MFEDIPTVAAIRGLTDEAIERIELAHNAVKRTKEWQSGMAALSDAYGFLLDDEGLEYLEDAVLERTDALAVTLAVRWYYLAYHHQESLVNIQIEALAAPWRARHG